MKPNETEAGMTKRWRTAILFQREAEQGAAALLMKTTNCK